MHKKMPLCEFRVTWLHLAGDDPEALRRVSVQATSVPNAITKFYALIRAQGLGKGRERAGFHILDVSNMSLKESQE